MTSNEFWICVCDMNNLHVMEEMRCQMCGEWNDSKVTRRVNVRDLRRMLDKYTTNGKCAIEYNHQSMNGISDVSNPPIDRSGVPFKPAEPNNILFTSTGKIINQ